ncbi:3-oxoacyl-ACP reductase FabG [Clostridia bacterium OttesenSCG-928-O13]|nr:3-oxoacyl-ACP reductase FabG [Clostridia bacterium OttesenSCG-928-O13]
MKETVFITGASGGIGAAVARAFAKGGNAVALGCHKNVHAAEELCRELVENGAAAAVCPGNVGDAAQVEAMFAGAEAQLGPVSVLVNGAGLARQQLFCDISETDWAAVLGVNLTGTFLCCRRALPSMIAQKRGGIINISSMWGQVGASCEVHYSAAKAGVIGLTKALAKEVGPCGIRVNCVAPGVVDTAMMADFTEEDREALREETPLGRLGTPEEIAAAVLFLASEQGAFFTGQVLAPNGGFVI